MRSIIHALSLSIILSLTFVQSITYAAADAPQGDAAAGKTKSATCAGCHGNDGNSLVPSFPKLAGQHTDYIAKQLAAFKSGERTDATMQGMASALSDEDMLDLSAYYNGQTPKVGEVSADMMDAAKAGEAIFRAGVEEFSVSACMACHGADAKGVAPNFPRLSGQHSSYIEKQLLAYKSGERKDSIMNGIAFPLSAEQIKNLSIYISGLY